jgi:hypothetical protein
MTLKGNVPTATFTITAGSAGAVTLTTGNAPAAMPNGVYTITVGQDESGTTIMCATPVGAIQQDGVMHSGSD